MIQFSEISDAEVDGLALFFATNGQQGHAPEWHKMFSLAVKVNAPVWDVEEVLATYDKKMERAIRREWLRRAMVVMFAEAKMRQMQMDEVGRRVRLVG